jgi:Tol biopolymer transport system component
VAWLRLTDPALVREPDSPEWRGDSIAFEYLDATDHLHLGHMNEDGSNAILYTDVVASSDRLPRWVTDGLLAYSSNRVDTVADNYDLWNRDLASGTTRRLTSFAEKEFSPAPRPGLPSLAYTEGADPFSGRITLIPDTAATTLTRVYLTSAMLVAGEPAWDLTGDRLCFSVEDPDGSRHIWLLTLSGTTVTATTQLTTGAAHDMSPRFSTDGTKLLFVSDRNGRSGVWWVSDQGSANGLELISFEDLGAVIRSPSWSPDGQRIVLSSDGRGGRAIWVLSNLGL